MKSIFLFLLIALLYSCTNSKKSDSKFVKTGTTIFQITSKIPSNDAGSIKIGDSTYYVFPFTETYKKIFICDKQGLIIDSISLKYLSELGVNMGRISYINRDSIVVVSFYSNEIFLINHDGALISQTKMPNIINGYDCQLIPLNNLNCYYSGGIWCFSGGSNTSDSNLSSIENIYNYYRLKKEDPYLIRIENPFQQDKVSSKYYIPGFEKRFVPEKFANLSEGRQLAFIDDTIVFCTNLTDSIYKFAGEPLSLIYAAKIKSEYSNIHQPLLLIDSVNQESFNNLFFRYGYIRKLIYDKERGLFYIAAMHDNTTLKKSVRGVPKVWSLIILDCQFRKLGEHFFAYNTYFPSSIMIHPEGVLIQKVQTENLEKYATFDIFTFKN